MRQCGASIREHGSEVGTRAEPSDLPTPEYLVSELFGGVRSARTHCLRYERMSASEASASSRTTSRGELRSPSGACKTASRASRALNVSCTDIKRRLSHRCPSVRRKIRCTSASSFGSGPTSHLGALRHWFYQLGQKRQTRTDRPSTRRDGLCPAPWVYEISASKNSGSATSDNLTGSTRHDEMEY